MSECDFRVCLLGLSLALAGSCVAQASIISGPPSAARATVIYDASNGDVRLDPNGNTMTGFDLWDSAGNFFVGLAIFPPGFALTANDATEKFCLVPLTRQTTSPAWDLGNIAPARLTEAQLVESLNHQAGDSVWYKAGGGSFNYNSQYVPEPDSTLLLMAAALLLLTQRRRGSR